MSVAPALEPQPANAERTEAKLEAGRQHEGQHEVAPPRKRGRPRTRPEPDPNEPKRPRGRPKGSNKVPVTGPKRPRGRPPKESTKIVKSSTNTPGENNSELKHAASGDVKKGRGRPKKSATTTGEKFIQRADLPRHSSGLICDVTGVVTFVSSDIREKKQGMQGYWMYRWIHLRDGTSNSPIIVKIFACSQPEVLKAITLDQVVVCTRVLLKVWAQSSRERRYCYLTTTSHSQISILHQASDLEDKPFKSNAAVNDVIKIWRTLSDAVMDKSCSGGLYTFPPLPVTLKDFFPGGHSLDLVDVRNIFDKMHFQQHTRLNLRGTVVAMEYIPVSSSQGFNAERQAPVCGTGNSSSTASSSQQTSQANCNGVSTHQVSNQSQYSSTDKGKSQTRQQRKRKGNTLKQNSEACCTNKHREDVTSAESKTEQQPATTSVRLNEKHREDVTSAESKTEQQPATTSVRLNEKHREDVTSAESKTQQQPATTSVRLEHEKHREDVTSAESKTQQQPATTSVRLHEKHKLGKTTKQSSEELRPKTTWTETSPYQRQQRYFPHIVLDHDWWEDTDKIPIFGNTCVSKGIPKLCSRSCTGTRELPVAHREGFGRVKGYWRLVIMEVHRPIAISTFFLPLHKEEADCVGKVRMASKETAPDIDSSKGNNADHEDTAKLGNEASPKNDQDDRACPGYDAAAECSEKCGVFSHALSHGVFPASYSIQELLDIAAQELKDQPFVFVLDAFCHGQGEVEVVVNRAY